MTEELKAALAHLDDPPYLETLPLAQRLAHTADISLSRGQVLRRLLRRAIASLDPELAEDTRLYARSYQTLYQYSILRHSMTRIAVSLGISPRQAYRDFDRAVEALALMVQTELGGCDDSADTVTDAPHDQYSFLTELDAISVFRSEPVALKGLVSTALDSVAPLAESHCLNLVRELGVREVVVHTNRVVLRQAILTLVSHIILSQAAGCIRVSLEYHANEACLAIEHDAIAPRGIDPQTEAPVVSDAMFERLGMRLTATPLSDGMRLTVWMPVLAQTRVLVIDDNQGFVALFQRFLSHLPYTVTGAGSLNEAIPLVQKTCPDVIVLDIMMPDRDGWETLQVLRSCPGAENTPVIICSVINVPDLAASLGAVSFLNKPVTQSDVTAALEAALSRK